MKYVPFTIYIPEITPGQGTGEHEIHAPVHDNDGIETLTLEAHEMIEQRKMQLTISRLVDAVRELYKERNNNT